MDFKYTIFNWEEIVMNLFGGTISTLEKALDYSTTKNKLISNNIANVDTPNYKAQKVSFKDTLDSAINSSSLQAKTTDERHIPFATTKESFNSYTKGNTMYNNNKNNVDVDQEMAELAKNQIYHHSLIDRLSGKFKSIQTVIRGGNG